MLDGQSGKVFSICFQWEPFQISKTLGTGFKLAPSPSFGALEYICEIKKNKKCCKVKISVQ